MTREDSSTRIERRQFVINESVENVLPRRCPNCGTRPVFYSSGETYCKECDWSK